MPSLLILSDTIITILLFPVPVLHPLDRNLVLSELVFLPEFCGFEFEVDGTVEVRGLFAWLDDEVGVLGFCACLSSSLWYYYYSSIASSSS